jgi:hypothetical protein
LALGLLFVAVSCGGAAERGQPAATPVQSAPAAKGIAPEPESLPEAERALEQARSELEGGLAGGAKADREASGGERDCATACRAFASLKRAADAVCRLAGPDEQPRCARARGVVAEGERRVAGCGCS